MYHSQNHTLSMGSRLDTTLTGGEGGEQEEKKKTTKLRQATLNWPTSRIETEITTKKKEPAKKRTAEVEEGVWIDGGRQEDNNRYRAFLKYCEERREEAKQRDDADDERKKGAKQKEEHWKLLGLCIKEIKENEEQWTTRKKRILG